MSATSVIAEGLLHGLSGELDDPIRYTLDIGDTRIALNERLGQRLRVESLGRYACRNCGRDTRKPYGGGYCYLCFSTLARCDLCVMSPDRCHYAAGTCREPEWGRSFCMQPHLVYLANSGGVKVGITRLANVPFRFIDQGASEAMVVMQTATRHQAGVVEKALGRHLREQADWRALVGGAGEAVDLERVWAQVQLAAAAALTEIGRSFPDALVVAKELVHVRLRYPVLEYSAPLQQLRLENAGAIGGILLGIKGPYLLFDQGVFNVRGHASLHVRAVDGAIGPIPRTDQMELFR